MLDTRIADSKRSETYNSAAIAARYDTYAVVQRQAAQDLLAFTGALAPRAILEPGCGTGLYTRLLLRAFPRAALVGLDISPAMLRVAQRRIAAPAVRFVLADAEEFCSGRYDLITSNATFQWFTRLEETVARLAGLLVPGGTLSFSFFGPGTYRELDGAMAEVLGDATRVTCRRFADGTALAAALRAACRRWEMEEVCYAQTFPSLRALLLGIKYTSSRGPRDVPQAGWTPGRLARIERAYRERHGEIRASYQVFLCKGWP